MRAKRDPYDEDYLVLPIFVFTTLSANYAMTPPFPAALASLIGCFVSVLPGQVQGSTMAVEHKVSVMLLSDFLYTYGTQDASTVPLS